MRTPILHPRIWQPGAQVPPEHQRLNYAHPLVQNPPLRPGAAKPDKTRLRAAWVFNASRGVRDRVVPAIAKAEGFQSPEAGSIEATFRSDSLDCRVNGACVFFESPITWASSQEFAVAFTFSCTVLFPLHTPLAGMMGENFWYWNNGPSHICFGRTITLDPNNLSAGWHRLTVSGAFGTGGIYKMYIDGEFFGDFNASGTGAGFSMPGWGNMNCVNARNRGVAMQDMFMWEGCLSESAIREHAQDPYAMFYPSVLEEPYIRAAAPAPGGEGIFLGSTAIANLNRGSTGIVNAYVGSTKVFGP